MMPARTILSVLACTLALLAAHSEATRSGDEGYAVNTKGYFYQFASKSVNIIDPLTMTVVKNLTVDSNGAPLTNNGSTTGSVNASRSWNDAVYMESPTLNLYYVCVNEGDVYLNGTQQVSYVSCIDTVSQKFISRVAVGGKPVHLYWVAETATMWSHSDAEGTFYVIRLADTSLVNTTVPSYVATQKHGKLVVDGTLYPKSYGTNVGEQYLQVFNLSNTTRTRSVNYGPLVPAGLCTGTHTITYSNASQHLFIECVDQSGTLEWNSVSDTLVAFHTSSPGQVTASPANDRVFVVDADNSTVNVFTPTGNTVAAAGPYQISVPGNPGNPVFYSNYTVLEDILDYSVFFPLIRVTNINNIRGAAAAGSSVLQPGYFNQPTDCSYSQTVTTASVTTTMLNSTGLSLATNAAGALLTPGCGSCAAGVNSSDPSQFNTSLSGLMVLNYGDTPADMAANTEPVATLISAGAAAPKANAATGANACSYAETYRTAVRGGPFVAVPAALPQPSLYVVDAAAPGNPLYGSGFVVTSPQPTTTVWAPVASPNLIYSDP